MDDFKLDALWLDDPFKTPVCSVNAEFELLFKLWTVGVLHCAGFVPLRLLLHKHRAIEQSYTTINTSKDRFLPHWGKGTQTSHWRPGHLGRHLRTDVWCGGEYVNACCRVTSKVEMTLPEGAGRLMPLTMYSMKSLGVRLWWILEREPASWVTDINNLYFPEKHMELMSVREQNPQKDPPKDTFHLDGEMMLQVMWQNMSNYPGYFHITPKHLWVLPGCMG